MQNFIRKRRGAESSCSSHVGICCESEGVELYEMRSVCKRCRKSSDDIDAAAV